MGDSRDEGPPPAEEKTFAELLEEERAPQSLQVGQVVSGRVLQIGADDVFVDVSGKGEGVLARSELLDESGQLSVAVGDTVEATVVALQPEVRLSRRLAAGARAREMLEAAVASGIPVQGRVAGLVKGGFEVTVAGQRAFCPLSQMALHRIEDQSAYLGQTYDFRVTEMKDDGRSIVVSRRRLLAEEAKQRAEETRRKVVPGAVLEGEVCSLAAFGAFVDLGGLQGLLHVSEISHQRLERAAEVLQIGQRIAVQVLKVDPATGKISLSRKALEGDPWAAVPERLHERQVVEGRIVRVADFGAFVELLPGVDGLLHLSELPHGAAAALREAARARATTEVLILEIDTAKRRISLAPAPRGAAAGDVVEGAKLGVGATITGKVEEVKPFGVVLRLGPGQTGVIPNNEMATPRGTDHAKEFPPGTEIAAEVMAIEQGGRRIRLSRARAIRSEERAEMQRHAQVEQKGSLSTFGDLLRAAQQKRR